MFRIALFLFVVVLLAAHSSNAQMPDAITTLDQSLFNSEPVEEMPAPDAADVPPAPVNKNTESPAEPIINYDAAQLQGLNKVTAETLVFEASLNEPAMFGALTITLKKCNKSKANELPENVALMLITDHKSKNPKGVVFSGWMFSSSPSISALEHPVYDITVLECVVHKKS